MGQVHKNMPVLSVLHNPCLIPEPCCFARTLNGCLIWHSVYSVATDGEAVYFQQIFLRPSVLQSISFKSCIDIDNFVIILIWRGQE